MSILGAVHFVTINKALLLLPPVRTHHTHTCTHARTHTHTHPVCLSLRIIFSLESSSASLLQTP